MNDLELYTKLVSLPDELKKEANDFVEFLKSKIANQQTPKSRTPGLAKGLIEMSDDFDEPLDDFKEYRE
ncbi:DUF2281 domain-containing protein [Halalkalibaculum sp. DA3122]|uniref:type II toxin-antitoxin system VapB family antitoxin n=1 Tax=unclassified Halalkalibaculum TaxID=2964617 RepID=UPI003754C209